MVTCACGIAAHARCQTCDEPFCQTHGAVHTVGMNVMSRCLQHAGSTAASPRKSSCSVSGCNLLGHIPCTSCKNATCSLHNTNVSNHDFSSSYQAVALAGASKCPACAEKIQEAQARRELAVASAPTTLLNETVDRLTSGSYDALARGLSTTYINPGWWAVKKTESLGRGFNLGHVPWEEPRFVARSDVEHADAFPTGLLLAGARFVRLDLPPRSSVRQPVPSHQLQRALDQILATAR